MSVGETVDAKARLGRADALELAAGASSIIVARGKKVTTFDMKNAPPDDRTLLAHLLGPTGKLRAPTIQKGKTLLVGFNDKLYADMFG